MIPTASLNRLIRGKVLSTLRSNRAGTTVADITTTHSVLLVLRTKPIASAMSSRNTLFFWRMDVDSIVLILWSDSFARTVSSSCRPVPGRNLSPHLTLSARGMEGLGGSGNLNIAVQSKIGSNHGAHLSESLIRIPPIQILTASNRLFWSQIDVVQFHYPLRPELLCLLQKMWDAKVVIRMINFIQSQYTAVSDVKHIYPYFSGISSIIKHTKNYVYGVLDYIITN